MAISRDSLSPKLNLIYYKHILDNAVVGFFRDNNDSFRKTDDGLYVYSAKVSRNRIKADFRKRVVDEVKKYAKEYSILSPQCYLIIGSCLPKDNVLLGHTEGRYFPEKLLKVVKEHPNLKYVLAEKDLRVDLDMFNGVFDEIFTQMFDHRAVVRLFGRERSRNIYFVKSRKLDSYMTYRAIKDIYGAVNIVNLYERNKETIRETLVSINGQIRKYVPGQKAIIRSDGMKMTVNEIGQYVGSCIMNCVEGK